jgi:hypothetical protein
MAWLAPVEGMTSAGSTCRRIPVAPGVEVLMDEQHPALRLNSDPAVIAEALRQALASLVGMEPFVAGEERGTGGSSWIASEPEPRLLEEAPLSSEPAD